jgi:hypothetical protein
MSISGQLESREIGKLRDRVAREIEAWEVLGTQPRAGGLGVGRPVSGRTEPFSMKPGHGQWFISSEDALGMPTELQLCSACNAASVGRGAQVQVTFTCMEIL